MFPLITICIKYVEGILKVTCGFCQYDITGIIKEVSCMIIHVICFQCNPTMLFSSNKKKKEKIRLFIYTKNGKGFSLTYLYMIALEKNLKNNHFVLLITSIFIVLIYRNLPYYHVISFVVNFVHISSMQYRTLVLKNKIITKKL